MGAIDAAGRAVLDIGVMSFDAKTAVLLLCAFDVRTSPQAPRFSDEMESLVLNDGIDLYREICCALGSEATREHHRASCRSSGSTWPDKRLYKVFGGLHRVPLSTVVLPQCNFLHFGTTEQLIMSGLGLLDGSQPAHFTTPTPRPATTVSINNRMTAEGRILGRSGWVEGCRLAAPLRLRGRNVVVGIDVDAPLELPRGACLDVLEGQTRAGRNAWFVRTYSVDDTFKDTLDRVRHARWSAVGKLVECGRREA